MDVPIFSLVPKGVKGAPRDIVEDDLQMAVDLHDKMFREDKFLARTNVLHNFGIHRATPAGFFLPRSVRPFRMKGKTHPVIFADLIGVPDPIFRDLDSDRLPYCSPEVRTYEPLQFGALALLDTEPPFFEFPLITIGEREEHPDAAEFTKFDQAVGPAVGAFVSAQGSAFLFRFAEDVMPDEVEKKKDDEKAQMMEGDALDVAGIVKAIESGEIAVKDFAAIKAAMDSVAGAEAEPEEEVSDGPVDQPVAAMSAKSEDAAKTIQRLSGRVAGLEEYRERVEREKARDLRFSSAVTKLETDGYTLTEGTRKRLFAQAELGDEAVAAIVDTIREGYTQDPPDDLPGVPGDESWPAEVMHYAQRGPGELAEAKEAYRAWREMPNDRYRSPLEKFLQREVG